MVLYTYNSSENYPTFLNVSGQQEISSFFSPTARYVQFSLILTISLLVIISNVINISILRMTKQIPLVSRIFLTNLGIADLCTGLVVCLPCVVPALTKVWPYGAIWCQIASVLYGTCISISIWSISLVSLERYIAVVHPVVFKTSLTSRRCVRALAAFWIGTIIVYICPILSKPNFIYYQFYPANVMCGFYWEYPWFCYVLATTVPVVSGAIILFSTFKTIKSLNRINPISSTAVNTRSEARRAHSLKAVRLVTLTAISYFSMWVPYCVIGLTTASDPNASDYISPWTEFITMWLGNANSFMNVIIYSGIYPSFRKNLIDTLCCRKRSRNTNDNASIQISRTTEMVK